MSGCKWVTVLVAMAVLLGSTGLCWTGEGSAGEAKPALKVSLSSSGMEGLKELWVQAHVACDADWKELTGLDEEKVRELVKDGLRLIPSLRVMEGQAGAEKPRLLVIVVGHVIADAEGEKATAATNLAVSLNQPVTVRRRSPSGEPIHTTGMTWQRSLLITGLKETMRQRVEEKLRYLVGQFGQEYSRCNPRIEESAALQ